jgi:hypothetical protein
MNVKTFNMKPNARLQENLLINCEVKHLHFTISYTHSDIKETTGNDARRMESCFLFEFNGTKVK